MQNGGGLVTAIRGHTDLFYDRFSRIIVNKYMVQGEKWKQQGFNFMKMSFFLVEFWLMFSMKRVVLVCVSRCAPHLWACLRRVFFLQFDPAMWALHPKAHNLIFF